MASCGSLIVLHNTKTFVCLIFPGIQRTKLANRPPFLSKAYYRTSLTKANGTKYSAFSVPTDPRLVFEVTALRTACRLHFAAAFVLSERKIDHCAGHSPLLAAGALFVQDAIVVFVASTAITCEPCRKNHQCDDTLSMFWNGPNRLSMIQGLQRD